MNKCNLCSYEWESRTDDPKQCPRCKRYDWKEDKDSTKQEIASKEA